MFATMARFEFMNIIRERMTAVMLIWPLVIGGLAKYAIHSGMVEGQAAAVIAMFMTLLAGFAFGAMAGFSLLDDRDDQVFASIQISPVSLRLYIWFKICFVWFLAVLAGFLIISLVGIAGMTTGEVLLVSVLSALQVPIVAFLVNSFAKNKVEGFVTMKATGFLLMFPIGGFFFLDVKEWLFAPAPAHWAAKAVQYIMLRPLIEDGFVSMNLNFYQYIGLGVLYNLLLIAATYSFFVRKNDI
jgi:fluoroquinolone transport system permease protein